MNNEDIKYLLDRFYEGTSSQEEERSLKQFFLSDPVPEEWKEEKELFVRYLRVVEIPVPEELEERLSKKISVHAAQKRITPTRSYLLRILSAAAIVLLCVSIFFGNLRSGNGEIQDTFEDPAEAALVAQETLMFLSRQLNNGINQMKEAQEEINKINHIVYKQFKD